MRESTREKLDQLDALFPKSRLQRSRERWRRLWSGEEPIDRLPLLIAPIITEYYDVTPAESRLAAYLDKCIARGRVEDDFIPSFFPGCHQGALPGMFGAKEIVADGDYTCERLFDDFEQLTDLPEPVLTPGSVTGRWLAMQRWVLEETEGRLPIHVADMQGPVDVAGQLLGYDQVFLAAYEEPALYDRLLRATTRAFTMFWGAQQELLGDAFVGTHLFGWDYMPPGFGVTASMDSLVMVSPAFYERHCQTYLEHMGALYGGLTVHSCGDFRQVAPSLMRTKGLRGINASQMSIPQLVEAGIDGSKVIIGLDGMQTIDRTMGFIREHNLRTDLAIHGVWPERNGARVPDAEWTARDWEEIRRKNDKLLDLYRA